LLFLYLSHPNRNDQLINQMSSENNNANKAATNKQITAGKSNSRKWRWGIAVVLIGVALYGVFGLKLFKHDVLMTSKSYGKVGHQVSYDKNNVTEEEVDYLATGLTKVNFFDEVRPKYVYIKKDGSSVEINISCNPSINTNKAAIESFVHLRADMQKQFPHNKIVINLVIDRFDNVVKRIE
jgi:hypothetical protein